MLDFQHVTQMQKLSSKKAAAEQSSRPTGSPHPASEPVENALEQDGKQRAVRYVSGRRRTASNAGELRPSMGCFLPNEKKSPSLPLCGAGFPVHQARRRADDLFARQTIPYPCKRYPRLPL